MELKVVYKQVFLRQRNKYYWGTKLIWQGLFFLWEGKGLFTGQCQFCWSTFGHEYGAIDIHLSSLGLLYLHHMAKNGHESQPEHPAAPSQSYFLLSLLPFLVITSFPSKCLIFFTPQEQVLHQMCSWPPLPSCLNNVFSLLLLPS